MDAKTVLLVGHFSSEGACKNKAASIAGDLVQLQMIKESQKILGKKFKYISLEPCQCWPTGPLWVNGTQDGDDGFFPPVLNLPLLKGLLFSLFVFFYSLKINPNIIVQYNSYLFENIAVLLLKYVIRSKVVIVMQDVRLGSAFSKISAIYDKVSNLLVKHFDLVIPVSRKLAYDLNLHADQYYIFLGGVTEPGLKMLGFDRYTEEYAVFAGALEPHNGIDKLLSAWVEQSLNVDLHIFGRGSLSDLVRQVASAHNNIIYHGFLPQDTVAGWQAAAKFNICLRYSEGLEEEYFFPSKIFNIACCPGLLICNSFKNLPSLFLNDLGMLCNDLSNLKMLENIEPNLIAESAKARRRLITNNHSWLAILERIYS